MRAYESQQLRKISSFWVVKFFTTCGVDALQNRARKR